MAARAIGRLTRICVALGLSLLAGAASAQTYGFATLPPGSLSHVISSAIAKVLKEKAGLNVLVQPTAGGNVVTPMVARGEAEIGVVNIMEAQNAYEAGQKDLRMLAAIHALRTPFFVRKDSPLRNIGDLKGKRVAVGYSAMGDIDTVTRAMLATAGLTEADVKPVRVPNVVRGADDFMSGNADMFFFAFGGPKVREADATVGGLRVLEIDPNGMPAARKIMRWGYLTRVQPGSVFTGVEKPMEIYSFDNVLITHAKVADDFVYKVIEAMANNKDDLIAIQPVLREFTPAFGYKQYSVPYHPGAIKYFSERKIAPRPVE
jgi:TRAP transporter TAXI family solute receptor